MSGEESTSRSGTSQSGGASIPYDYGYGDKKSIPHVWRQDLMEILKNFPGGKPTSTVMSWVLMKNYGTYWKTVLVT